MQEFFYCKFNKLSSSESILKMGYDLAKLSSQYGGTFLRHSVETNRNKIFVTSCHTRPKSPGNYGNLLEIQLFL